MAKDLGMEQGWPLRNDQIVLAVISGRSTAEVAEEHELSRQQVNNIMNHEKAQELIKLARQKFRERVMESIEDQLDMQAQLALKVIHRTLEADIAPVHKAKANQDRVALKMLQGRGFLRAEDRTGEGGVQMTGEQFSRLTEGMEKSDRARLINPFAPMETDEPEVIEAVVIEDLKKAINE